ncbi:MAG TPA: BMP family ABC transporter substrate-binding protein [Clostridia bacterium]|nr:BMP family ABC transporter substrate-binding protein [Clostridia bacterium]
MKKRGVFSIFIALVVVLTMLSGCTNVKEASSPEKQEPVVKEEEKAKIGIVFTTAGLGGQSFNDLVYEGVKRAEKELGIEYDYVEPKSVSDEEIVQDEMSGSGEYDLIICIGFEQVDALKRVAAQYPEQKYAMIDATIDLPNVSSYVSKDNEGSFLVGVLAALAKEKGIDSRLSNNKTFGFIGGVDSPVIRKFNAGFEAGVRYVNKDNKIMSDYAGSFNDPTNAKVISGTMNQKGADIIYHAAGGSGVGLFQAAKEKDFIAIGVNSNQNGTDPDHIMASMLKLVDSAAYSVIKDVVDDKFQGGTHTLGIKEGGVGYTLEGSNIKVNQEIVDIVESIKEKISTGEIAIPEKIEDVNAFVEKNQYNQ